MPLYVKLYRDTDNPFGLPDDYPADSINSDNNPGQPWVRMSKSEYEALIDKNRDAVMALLDKSKSDKDASDSQKLDALKALFDEAEAVDNDWANATNAQKFELCRTTFKILRRQRRQILDQYRPE